MFLFSFDDLSNKPSPKFTDAGIRKEGDYLTKQRASQNWCLVRMFLLLFGDLIKEDNVFYSHFLQLLDILDIIFAPKIAPESIVILEDLIRQLYPNVLPINKFHHMVHYPEVIRMHGPPVTWCMRFEAFHNIVKKLAMTNCNFNNFAKSAAIHLQSKFCANMLNPDCFDTDKLVIGPAESGTLNTFITNCYDNEPIPEDGFVSNPKWMRYNGWEYRINSVVLLTPSSGTRSGLPEFGLICNIFVHHGNPFFVISSMITAHFDSHFH